MTGNIGCEVVEEVLTVVEVKHREATVLIREIRTWQVNRNATLVWLGEDGGVEAVAFKAGDGGYARGHFGGGLICVVSGSLAEGLWKQKAGILRWIISWLDRGPVEQSIERFGFQWMWQEWVYSLIYARMALR